MSLHSQLLRGLFALPLMLLLAVAGVIAPSQQPAAAQAMSVAHPLTVSVADDCDAIAIARVRIASR
jgi:hypothetical protein